MAGLLLLLSGHFSPAQDVPIVSGALGFLDSTNTGVNFFQPVAAPVVVAPLGKHFLAESRFDLRGFYSPEFGNTAPTGHFYWDDPISTTGFSRVRRLTVTGGRFLTPFGTYNERLTAIWIQKLQDAPLIFPIGTRTTGSSDGGMVRGVLFAKPEVHFDYIGYFSASSTAPQFQAGRAAGYRFDLYFPGKRVEIGTSYGRFLQGTHNNSTGAHFWWQPWRFPLEVRSEYAHGAHAQGYWIEMPIASRSGEAPTASIGRLEPVFRHAADLPQQPRPG